MTNAELQTAIDSLLDFVARTQATIQRPELDQVWITLDALLMAQKARISNPSGKTASGKAF